MASEHPPSPFAPVGWLAVAWLLGAGMLWWGDRTGPHDPACASYGTVCAGDLRFMLAWLTAEVLGLGLALRVWAPVPAWRRARRVWQAALILVVVSFPVTAHQGAVQTMHLRWLALLGVTAALMSRWLGRRAPAA